MNQFDLSDENIQLILERYKRKQIKDKERYQVNKTNPEFMMKNRQRAKDHYSNNKHLKQLYYEKHGELKKTRSLVNYYTKLGRLDDFKQKYPERWELYSASGSSTGSATGSATGSGESGGSAGSTSTTG